MKYTTEQIKQATQKRNATSSNILAMANGTALELSKTQLAYIRAQGIEPTLVGRGMTTNVAPGFRPVYRGSMKGVYIIEVEK